jgi:hypothetical protein
MTIQISDIVRPLRLEQPPTSPERFNFGVVLDIYEDDYGILYYEVHWITEGPEWWKETELELVSEGG